MRIQGVTIPENKRIEIGLTSIFGIGRSMAQKILNEVKIDYGKKPKYLTTEQENLIRSAIEKIQIEGDLKRNISSNIKRLKDISSYKGSRHLKRLPARGQRTKTNSRTVRGNVRKTMGSGKRSVEKK
jgi:small subunit ribosomal protein S13